MYFSVRRRSRAGRVCAGLAWTAAGQKWGPTLLLLAACGCSPEEPPQVVVYTALDRQFSEPILDRFTSETGIVVRPKYDTEATKTVGLTQTILKERERPRCDLFWNNEILNTMRLERAGLLRSYRSPAAANYPASMKSADGYWYGFAARARILIVNTHQVPESRRPKSIHDLIDPQWYDRCGIAKPLFGTTATHAACLFAVWGDEKAKTFFEDIKRNSKIMAGNKQVAQAVASGALAFGLTDTDDAIGEIEQGMPVAIVYPDQQPGQLGTLFIPNTIALIAGSANESAADQLLNYLLSAPVEKTLAEGASAQIPLNPAVEATVRVQTPETVRPMEVNFEEAAAQWDAAALWLREQFAAAD